MSWCICLFLSDFFHLVWSSLGLSMLLQCQYCILFNGWIIFRCVYIPQPLGLQVFFGFFFRATPTAHGGYQARGLTELQLPAYTTATAMPDLSHICDLHHSLWQCQILNLLSEPRDWTCNLMVPSQIHFCWAMMGTLWISFFMLSFFGWFEILKIPQINIEHIYLIHGTSAGNHRAGWSARDYWELLSNWKDKKLNLSKGEEEEL